MATHATEYLLAVGIEDIEARDVLRRGNLRGVLGRIMEGRAIDPREMKEERGLSKGGYAM